MVWLKELTYRLNTSPTSQVGVCFSARLPTINQNRSVSAVGASVPDEGVTPEITTSQQHTPDTPALSQSSTTM